MKLDVFYKKLITAGIAADPRPKTRINEVLLSVQKAYDKLTKEDKNIFSANFWSLKGSRSVFISSVPRKGRFQPQKRFTPGKGRVDCLNTSQRFWA